ncbi:MAG TPA: DNA-binding domain-containing protein [Steroidobacteraceae bacterium]|nr:DNA-binding domain-containing protein [Steroidobacteraceae bacterium]
MRSLRELQIHVMDALLGAGLAPVTALISGPRAAAERRLGVYANTVQGNFRDALQSIYPAVRRLVGEDYFRQTAREFQRRHPSRSGDLSHCGQGFPNFLAQLHPDDSFTYLADVARLEWLIQESLLAAEHASLDLESLARVPPAAYDGLRFELHPALRLFESRYPALAIWEVNVGSDAEPPTLDLRSGADLIAIARHRLRLQFHRLSAGEHCFLDAIARGECFAAAVDRAAEADAVFDASAALQRFVAAEAVVAFTSMVKT